MRLALFLLTLAALLVLASLKLDRLDIGAAPAQPPTAPSPRTPAQPRAPSPSLAALSAPPMFRPAAPPPPINAQPQPGQAFALVGLAGAPEARIAFLRDQADQRTFSARPGDAVGAWTLDQIEARCVVLRQARQRQNLCLS